MKRMLIRVAFGLALVYIFQGGTGFGIATAKAVPTSSCSAYTLASALGNALFAEQRAKSDLDKQGKWSFGMVEFLERAQEDLLEFKTLLVDTSCPPSITNVVDLCFDTADKAQMLDDYLVKVGQRNIDLFDQRARSSIAFPQDTFVLDAPTHSNLLGRAIEMKKDCLQALIMEGIIDGSETSTTTTPP